MTLNVESAVSANVASGYRYCPDALVHDHRHHPVDQRVWRVWRDLAARPPRPNIVKSSLVMRKQPSASTQPDRRQILTAGASNHAPSSLFASTTHASSRLSGSTALSGRAGVIASCRPGAGRCQAVPRLRQGPVLPTKSTTIRITNPTTPPATGSHGKGLFLRSGAGSGDGGISGAGVGAGAGVAGTSAGGDGGSVGITAVGPPGIGGKLTSVGRPSTARSNVSTICTADWKRSSGFRQRLEDDALDHLRDVRAEGTRQR